MRFAKTQNFSSKYSQTFSRDVNLTWNKSWTEWVKAGSSLSLFHFESFLSKIYLRNTRNLSNYQTFSGRFVEALSMIICDCSRNIYRQALPYHVLCYLPWQLLVPCTRWSHKMNMLFHPIQKIIQILNSAAIIKITEWVKLLWTWKLLSSVRLLTGARKIYSYRGLVNPRDFIRNLLFQRLEILIIILRFNWTSGVDYFCNQHISTLTPFVFKRLHRNDSRCFKSCLFQNHLCCMSATTTLQCKRITKTSWLCTVFDYKVQICNLRGDSRTVRKWERKQVSHTR